MKNNESMPKTPSKSNNKPSALTPPASSKINKNGSKSVNKLKQTKKGRNNNNIPKNVKKLFLSKELGEYNMDFIDTETLLQESGKYNSRESENETPMKSQSKDRSTTTTTEENSRTLEQQNCYYYFMNLFKYTVQQEIQKSKREMGYLYPIENWPDYTHSETCK